MQQVMGPGVVVLVEDGKDKSLMEMIINMNFGS